MDIKIGTSTLTKRQARKGEKYRIDREKRDAQKTNAKLGFNITGSSHEGKTNFYSKSNFGLITEDNVNDYLKVVFEV